MNKLLKGTRELPVIDMTYRDFMKPGGYDQAVRDFNAVTMKYANSKFAKFKSQVRFMLHSLLLSLFIVQVPNNEPRRE